MACASVSEFAAVALLSLLFTKETDSTSVRLALAGAFVGLIAVVGLVAARPATPASCGGCSNASTAARRRSACGARSW